jgi:malate synthase
MSTQQNPTSTSLQNVIVLPTNALTQKILTPECLSFLAHIQRTHNQNRKDLLQARVLRAQLYDAGVPMTYPQETQHIRDGNWTVAEVPGDLQRRWIEITGPPSKKGTINAMNCGADMWMCDLEDSLAPSWDNSLGGQYYLKLANERKLEFTENNKLYKLKDTTAQILVRPRGWHLDESHVIVDGEPMSGSLFDFGCYFFNNYQSRKAAGFGGVYYYLAKLETYLEARLWNSVFLTTQQYFGVPVGTIRATVLIETIGGALEMDEILYELKSHIVGLNAGRWDYIFSIIKKQKRNPEAVLPDRVQVGMTVPFMKAYTDRIV